MIAIFVNGAYNNYTRGYNFPIRTTPPKNSVSKLGVIFWGSPLFLAVFGHSHVRRATTLNFGPISTKLEGIVRAIKKMTQKDKLPRWFSVMLVPKLLLTPIKIRFFGPKTAKFGTKYAFLVILGQILPFFAHFVQCLTKNNVNKVPRWVFRYVGNKTFDFSSEKKDFLPKNNQIRLKIGIFGQFGPGHAGLFNALSVAWLSLIHI